MPFVLIFVGLFFWLEFVIRAWLVVGTDNYALVNSYTNSAMLGLWMMVFGGLWLLRKR